MARAKQTSRAEARRRYRQTAAEEPIEDAEAPEAEPTGSASGPTRRPATSTSTSTSTAKSTSSANASGRPSLGAAFREAYHAPHYREDLAALPGLLTLRTPTRIPFTRTTIGIPWFIVSAALVVLGFAALLPKTVEGNFMFQLLSLPPGGPTLPVLVVGFTAVRASYMLGLLIGLVDLAFIAVYAAIIPAPLGTTVSISEIITTAAVTGLPTSVLFAGSAAWYRRFLNLSSMRRAQQQRSSSRSRGGRSSSRR